MRILFVMVCLTGVSLYAADKPQSPDTTSTFSEESGEYQKKTDPKRKKLVKATLTQAACFENVGEGALFLVHAGISPTVDSKEEDTFRLDTKRFAEFEKEQARRRRIAKTFDYAGRLRNNAGAIWLSHQDIPVEELAAAVFGNPKKARPQTDQSSLA